MGKTDKSRTKAKLFSAFCLAESGKNKSQTQKAEKSAFYKKICFLLFPHWTRATYKLVKKQIDPYKSPENLKNKFQSTPASSTCSFPPWSKFFPWFFQLWNLLYFPWFFSLNFPPRLHYRKFFVKDAHLDAVSRCIEVIFYYTTKEFFPWNAHFIFNRKLSRNSIATKQKSPIMMLRFDISIEAKTKSLFSFILTTMQSQRQQNCSPSHLEAKKKCLLVQTLFWVMFRIPGQHRWMSWNFSTCCKICSRMKKNPLMLTTRETRKSRRYWKFASIRLKIHCWSSASLIHCAMSRQESCDCNGWEIFLIGMVWKWCGAFWSFT